MKGFYIEITNNLLEPKHRKKMGTAVWEFMWCLDKITKIDKKGLGWVLGGRPVKLKEIADELGIVEHNISKNLTKLKNEGYLEITRTPHGLVIKVWKAKKRFTDKGKRFTEKSKSIYRHNNDNTNIIIKNLKDVEKSKSLLKNKFTWPHSIRTEAQEEAAAIIRPSGLKQ